VLVSQGIPQLGGVKQRLSRAYLALARLSCSKTHCDRNDNSLLQICWTVTC